MRKTRRGCRPRISISKRGSKTVATFTGKFSKRCGTRSYARVISRPAEMIYGSMKSMWKREVGGTLKTKFAMGKAPSKVKPLLRTYSRTLAQILPSIDKDSNNVMARQLLLTIGAKHAGRGTPQTGANAVSAWLNSRGLRFPELRIENGSGLSRLARISARHVSDLLVDAYRSPFRDYLMKSLAVAGVDGTMKRRLRGSRVRGKGFFKTGSLKNVRSIAGYVKAANGKTYVMAILHNDPKASTSSLSAHNKLIEWVYEGGRSSRQQLARR
jgi:D-alanyl-D-alanine carboxypeptidase/D-alanyl-D-alanine-endopeptidase (penicillin-binding protein 4)